MQAESLCLLATNVVETYLGLGSLPLVIPVHYHTRQGEGGRREARMHTARGGEGDG